MTDDSDDGVGEWCVWLERATMLAVVAVAAVGVFFLCGGGR